MTIMAANNKNLTKLIQKGWTPTHHAEFLDLYNMRSMGGVASTLLAGVFYRNMHYIVVEHEM